MMARLAYLLNVKFDEDDSEETKLAKLFWAVCALKGVNPEDY